MLAKSRQGYSLSTSNVAVKAIDVDEDYCNIAIQGLQDYAPVLIFFAIIRVLTIFVYFQINITI